MSQAKKKTKPKLAPELRAIGKRAAERRKETGKTVLALADELGIHQSQLSRFENGSRLLELPTILRLCDALGAPKGYIFGNEGKPGPVEFIETDRRRRGSADESDGD